MIKFMEIRYLFTFSIAWILFGCETKEAPVNEMKADASVFVYSPEYEHWIKRQVEAKLQIPATEVYDLQIHTALLDRDTLQDAVILVNRKEYAYKVASSDGNTRFEELVGFTGPYNHVFTHIGGAKEIKQAPPVGSSADFPLTVFFETISTPSQTDFFVEYRIRSSINRNYYTIDDGRVVLTFSCPLYDFEDSQNPKIYDIRHLESEVRLSKDIGLYYAKVKDYLPDSINDFNQYYPKEIIPTEDLFVFFIFDKKSKKYVTPMRPAANE
jgi:hypothetical protein